MMKKIPDTDIKKIAEGIVLNEFGPLAGAALGGAASATGSYLGNKAAGKDKADFGMDDEFDGVDDLGRPNDLEGAGDELDDFDDDLGGDDEFGAEDEFGGDELGLDEPGLEGGSPLEVLDKLQSAIDQLREMLGGDELGGDFEGDLGDEGLDELGGEDELGLDEYGDEDEFGGEDELGGRSGPGRPGRGLGDEEFQDDDELRY